jgi:DNA polymerase
MDFNAIEARCLAWIAGEREQLQQFAQRICPYRRMAGKIYRLPIEAADALAGASSERSMGKATILGAGYQMGAKRFRAELAKNEVHISAAEAERIIATYREASPAIVALWRELERTALQAVAQPGLIVAAAAGRVRMRVRAGFLWLQLPSGRLLAYSKPRLEEREAPWGDLRPVVTFMGVDRYSHQWARQQAYGGRWTENVVQALARDLLAAAMLRLEAAGYKIVLTVHDEIVAEVLKGFGSVQEFERIASEVPPWAAGCPVVAESWRGRRYKK